MDYGYEILIMIDIFTKFFLAFLISGVLFLIARKIPILKKFFD